MIGWQEPYAALSAVIEAVGRPEFPQATAAALSRFAGFDLAALVAHEAAGPRLLYDNFDAIGARQGVQTYVHATWSINPLLQQGPRHGVVRARDFSLRDEPLPRASSRNPAAAYLVMDPEEELGFRTVGWPRHMEEIGVYFSSPEGVVELTFCRPRGRALVADERLSALKAMTHPLAAAFARHRDLTAGRAAWREALSPREAQVADLLLLGCGTEAVELRLGITRNTVKDYRKRIYRKLSISGLPELFALAGR
ncbi:MAG TPA: helix-turn-helix transcriptional regulator [Caulobacteraceae bacterium]|jgi:DNA-binding CsgD family transcriptional regulator